MLSSFSRAAKARPASTSGPEKAAAPIICIRLRLENFIIIVPLLVAGLIGVRTYNVGSVAQICVVYNKYFLRHCALRTEDAEATTTTKLHQAISGQ
jgi:hypothetical protein